MRAAILLAVCFFAVAYCAPKAAILTQTNAVNSIGNEIVLFLHSEDNTLSIAGRFPTWDFLGTNNNKTEGSGPGIYAPAFPAIDPLGSQYSVIVKYGKVYAVNAGSNDWSVLEILEDGSGLGPATTTPSLGSFPVSIDACGDWVLVANAGNGGALSGFKANADGTYTNTFNTPFGSNTTFVPTPIDGVGQVSFIRDCTQAVLNLKDGSTLPGRIWGINFNEDFEPVEFVENVVNDLVFSFNTFEAEDSDLVHIFTTLPASGGSAAWNIWPNLTITPVPLLTNFVDNGGEAAPCWNTLAEGNYMYVANTNGQSISSYSFNETTGALTLENSQAATGPGAVLDVASWYDEVSGLTFLYALWPEVGVVRVYVIDQASGNLTAATDGVGLDFTGAGVLPPFSPNSPTGAVGLTVYAFDRSNSPASFLAPSFLFVLALLKAFF